MYLVDTNVISEFRKFKSGKAHPNVTNWIKSVSANQIYLSVISIMEIEKGILSLERKDKIQSMQLKKWFENDLFPIFKERVLPINTSIAKECARLHIPNLKSDCDAFIGATAKCHKLILVTRNVADFDGMGIQILNPFDPKLGDKF